MGGENIGVGDLEKLLKPFPPSSGSSFTICQQQMPLCNID